MVTWDSWPSVPEGVRPKRLYVNVPLGPTDELTLKSKGWDPVDVRVLPANSDQDRQNSLKAWLEGVRQGSISLDKDIIKLIELEAKAYGLIGTRQIEPLKGDQEVDSIDELLSTFGGAQTTLKKAKNAYRERPTRQYRTAKGSSAGGRPYHASKAPMKKASEVVKQILERGREKDARAMEMAKENRV